MKLDMFDAYYLVSEFTEDGRPYLFGAARGHFVRVHPDVCLIRMAKDELPNDATGSIMCDFTPIAADPENSSFAWAMMNNFPPDTSVLHPVAAYLVQSDIAEGLDAEQIINRRAAIIVPEFLGFEEDHVRMVRPDLFATRGVEIDGETVVISNWTGGTLL